MKRHLRPGALGVNRSCTFKGCKRFWNMFLKAVGLRFFSISHMETSNGRQQSFLVSHRLLQVFCPSFRSSLHTGRKSHVMMIWLSPSFAPCPLLGLVKLKFSGSWRELTPHEKCIFRP